MLMPVATGKSNVGNASRCHSPAATNADAPPPNPFRIATICGIAVIFTALAIHNPTAEPITPPSRISLKLTMCWSSNVTTMASNMPTDDSRLPCRAVLGVDIHLKPMTNSTAATR